MYEIPKPRKNAKKVIEKLYCKTRTQLCSAGGDNR